jgi:uncharacterized protein YbjT (DUF2867 family)
MSRNEDRAQLSDGIAPDRTTVLLTGATGYVGGCLLHRLQADGRQRVRCLARRPEALTGKTTDETEVFAGDVLEPQSLAEPMRGVHTAYYLVHSMNASGDFEAVDRAAAGNFAAAAAGRRAAPS